MILVKFGTVNSATTSGFDADAQAYFTATGIVNATIQTGINQLVLDLKAASLWTKMTLISPFPDNSSTHCAYNLKNSVSILTYTGTPTFASTGMTPSATAWADTTISDSTMTFNDAHISYYSRTAAGAGPPDQWIMGTNDASSPSHEAATTNGATKQMTAKLFTGASAITSAAYANTQGLFTCTNQTDARIYRNAVHITSAPGTLVNTNAGVTFLIGSVRNAAGATCECAFFTLGTGLSATNVSDLYTVIQAYQTTLARQV